MATVIRRVLYSCGICGETFMSKGSAEKCAALGVPEFAFDVDGSFSAQLFLNFLDRLVLAEGKNWFWKILNLGIAREKVGKKFAHVPMYEIRSGKDHGWVTEQQIQAVLPEKV